MDCGYDASSRPPPFHCCAAASSSLNIEKTKPGASGQILVKSLQSHCIRHHIMAADLESNQEKAATSEDCHGDQQSTGPDQTATEQESKNNVVDWDGPDDAQNPRNWPAWKRMAQVILASAFLLTA